jgi:hypothetical protein
MVGDKLEAMQYVSESGALVLDGVFEVLMPHMTDIYREHSGIERIRMNNDIYSCMVIRVEDRVIKTFTVNFIKSNDGVWRVGSM